MENHSCSITEYAEEQVSEDSNRYVHFHGEIKKLMKKHKMFRNKSMFFEYLVQEGPWAGKSDKHRTWGKWYCKEKLIITSIGQEKMSRDTGVPIDTIKRWIRELENEDFIQRKYEWGELLIVTGKVIDGKRVYFYEML